MNLHLASLGTNIIPFLQVLLCIGFIIGLLLFAMKNNRDDEDASAYLISSFLCVMAFCLVSFMYPHQTTCECLTCSMFNKQENKSDGQESQNLNNQTETIEDSEGNKYVIIYNEDENPTLIKIEE